MKIYIASSWKTEELCLNLKSALEEIGVTVNLFCFPGHRTCNFNWEDLPHEAGEDIISFMKSNPIVSQAYHEDRYYLDNCDALIMVYPSGISAHLEMGTAMGQNKPTFIYGDLFGLKPEVWYMGVTGLYWEHQLTELLGEIKILQESFDENLNFP